jgi:hypothetical protein
MPVFLVRRRINYFDGFPGAARELDEPVPLDRSLASDGLLGFGDLLVDPAQRRSGA